MNQETTEKTLDLCNKDCTNCALSELRPTQVVNGVGPLDARIMIVGEAPGPDEDIQGQPFIGRAGKKLDSLLARAGIHRSQLRITNATRCFPKLRTAEGFRAPEWDEIETCLPYLEQEVAFIKPTVIVPVGNVALRAILGTKKVSISDYRGTEIWSEKYNCKIMPTFHPSAVMRNPNLEETVVEDFKRIWESSQSREITKREEGNYVVIDTIEKFDAFYERIMQVKEFSYDIESSGFNWQKDHVMCISFSWQKGTAVVLPITKWIGIEKEKIELKDKKVRRKGVTEVKQVEVVTKYTEDSYTPWWGEKQQYIMMNLLAIMTSDIPRIAQNGKFDDKFFLQKGWNLKPLAYDTLLMHYLLHETAKGQHGLKDMALQYTNMGEYDRELEEWFDANGMSADKNKNYARVPEPLLYKYSAADADVTFQLKQIFLPLIEKEGMLDLLERLVMPLNYTLTHIEFEGYKIDRVQLNKVKEELQIEMAKIEKEIRELITKAGIIGEVDLDSPKQLAKLFYEDLKLPIVKQTKKGSPCTDEEAMTLLKDKHEIPMKLVEYRGIAKLLRTYVIGIEEELDSNDRVHSSFHQESTETGRLGSRNPNLQNIVKDKRIKDMFVVEEENVLVEADEAQGEFRLWGAYSKDPQLLQDLINNLDIHRNTAAMANKISIEQATDDQRQKAKSIVFGLMFGEGVEDLSMKHGVTIEYAQLIKDTFFRRYPVAKQWRYDNVKRGRRDGFVKSFFGRVRHLPGINSEDNKVSFPDQQAAVNCVDEQTEILTVDGWKNYEELQIGTLIATKNPKTGELEWQPVIKINTADYNGPMLEFESNTFSALTTPNHRWLIDTECSSHRQDHYVKLKKYNIFKESQNLSKYGEDKIHLTVDSYKGNLKTPFTNDEVEFIGWLMTDGNYAEPYFRKDRKKIQKRNNFNLYQSLRANPQKCEKIESVIKKLGIKVSTYIYPRTQEKVWRINDQQLILKIRHWLPTRRLTSSFLLNLSVEQLNILYSTMLLGDGSWDKDFKRHRRFNTKTKEQIDIFSMLCVLIGKAHNVKERDLSKYKPISSKLQNIPKMGTINILNLKQRNRVQPNFGRKIIDNWQGIVWCPTVENETWIARRKGIVYITGNSPIQGCLSDYTANACNRILIRFKELGLRGKARNLVHDAIYMEIPKIELEESVKIMKEEMERKILGIEVPMIAEFKVGSTWGSLKAVKSIDPIVYKEEKKLVNNNAQNVVENTTKSDIIVGEVKI